MFEYTDQERTLPLGEYGNDHLVVYSYNAGSAPCLWCHPDMRDDGESAELQIDEIYDENDCLIDIFENVSIYKEAYERIIDNL